MRSCRSASASMSAGLAPEQRLGVAAQHAEPAARRIEQDAVIARRLIDQRRGQIRGDRRRARQAQPAQRRRRRVQLVGGDVDRVDARAVARQRQQVRRLAAVAGARVHDSLAGRRAAQLGDDLGAGVRDREQAVTPGGGRRGRRQRPRLERVGRDLRRRQRRTRPLGRQPRRQLVARHAAGVRPQRHRRGLPASVGERDRVGRRQLGQQQPRRASRACRSPPGSRPDRRRRRAAAARRRAPAGAAARSRSPRRPSPPACLHASTASSTAA